MDYQVNGTFHKNKQLARESRTAYEPLISYIPRTSNFWKLTSSPGEARPCSNSRCPRQNILKPFTTPKNPTSVELVVHRGRSTFPRWNSVSLFYLNLTLLNFTNLLFVPRWMGTHNRKWIVCLGQRLSSPQQQHTSRLLRWSLFCSMGEPFFRFIYK